MEDLPLVARVITRLNVGGPARHALILSKGLNERGYRTALVTGSVSAREGLMESSEILDHTNIESLKRPLAPIDDFVAARSLSAFLKRRRPRILHTHMAKAGALGRLVARSADVPLVVHTFHGHVLEGYFSGPKEAAFIKTERWLARRTDALIAVSSQIRDALLELGIGRPDQWHVVSLGLDLDDLLESTVDNSEARRALGLPSDGVMVGIVGRLVPIKDHETFLCAAEQVLEERPDVHFVVAGDGELRVDLEAQATRRLGGRVTFLGWVNDLPKLYGALDLVVLTSRNEGTPVALIEAGAAGLPTVATDVGGVADVVADGETGYLVATGDAGALMRKIVNLIDDPQRRVELGKAARKRVADRFLTRRLIRDVADLYDELLAKAARG